MLKTSTFWRALVLLAGLTAGPAAQAQQAPGLALPLAQRYLASQRARLKLSAVDVADPAITSTYSEPRTRLTHVYLRQRCQGLEVYGTESDLHLDAAGRVVSQHLAFRPDVTALARAAAPTPALTPAQAVAAAARALGIGSVGSPRLAKPGLPAAGLVLEVGPPTAPRPVPVKLLYRPRASGELQLVWEVLLEDPAAPHYWSAHVDAQTGQLVSKADLTVSETTSFARLARQLPLGPASARPAAPVAAGPAAVQRTQAVNGYNVWPVTVESPSHGVRQVVLNPADARYSPFGWHDTDGVAGPEYTTTRGNNVFAYEDRAATNAIGYSPDGGTNLDFDFPFNAAAAPIANQDAAITNLFYWNNMMHDLMAYKGFFEAAGNFQIKNYTGLGTGGDPVLAEAQDGDGTSNANFATPPEGYAPRMQMYLWPATTYATLRILSSGAAGQYQAVAAGFGRPLSATAPFTGQLVLISDATLNTLGCDAPFSNAAAIAGKIAVIDRGICPFATKVHNAVRAGAAGVILVNNVAGSPFSAVSTDTVGIRIPVVMVSLADGQTIKAALAGTTPVTGSLLAQASLSDRDGDLDNGIVAHEYGHGITTRLTGGPATSICLLNAEQMGEGWSDFFGLWTTTKPGDNGATPRGVGTYALFQPNTGDGIRSQPYTTDFSINNLTYALVGTQSYSEVHETGTIWCATLWDMNWALINRYGYNPDLKGTTGGNNLALQLVLDGCKLQPCQPGFIDGRDAILKADSLFNGAANAALIWQVFARRGMGYGASQGSSDNLTDQVPSFLLPPGTTPLSTQAQQLATALQVYPNPAEQQLTVRLGLRSAAPVEVTMYTLLGARVLSRTVAAATLETTGVQLDTSSLPQGFYLLKLSSAEGVATKKVLIRR